MPDPDLEALAALLNESPADRVREQQQRFRDLSESRRNRLVLFGAGGLGRKALHGLRSLDIEPLGFSDNNPQLWGREVDGLLVFSPAEAATRFGADALFVVTIWSPGSGHRFVESRRRLAALGCSGIAPFLTLFWRYPETFLPHCFLDLPHAIYRDAVQVREAFHLMADEPSRREFVAQLRWRALLEFDALAPAVPAEQYFPPDLFTLSDDECFVDCGAYDGDTLRAFLERSGGSFRRYVGLEPDPANFRKLQACVASMPAPGRDRSVLLPLAVGERRAKARFRFTGSASSMLAQSGGDEVEVAPLDELLDGTRPTMIKMDIEGAELDAIQGARRAMRSAAPLLSVCVYHQMDHLWRVPLAIRDLRDDYRFFLRPHGEEGWDLVCYALPPDRLDSTAVSES